MAKDTSETTAAQEEETIRGTQSTARLSIWVAVAIIVIALIGYLTSHSSFTEQDVVAGIGEISQDMEGYMQANQYDGQFVYQSIQLEGGIFSRKAIIKHPSLVFNTARSGWMVSAPALIVKPSGAGMHAFDLMLEQEEPIMFEDGDRYYELTTQHPLSISVKRDTEAKKMTYAMDVDEESQYTLVDQSNKQQQQYYVMRLGAGSVANGTLDLAEKSYYEEATLVSPVVEFSSNIIKMDTLHSVYETAVNEGANLHHYTVETDSLTMAGALEALGKLSVAFELEDAISFQDDETFGNHTLEIADLTVGGEDFSLKGDGKLQMKNGEGLPFGVMNLTLASPDALLQRLGRAAVIPEVSIPVVKSALLKAATPVSEGDDTLALTLQRTPGGAFMIGNKTFEELTVSVIADILKGAKAAKAAEEAAPAVEEAPKEKETPAATTEEAPAVEESTPAADAVDVVPEAADAAEKAVEESAEAVRKAQETLDQLQKEVVPAEESAPAEEAAPAAEEAPAEAPAPEQEKTVPLAE